MACLSSFPKDSSPLVAFGDFNINLDKPYNANISISYCLKQQFRFRGRGSAADPVLTSCILFVCDLKSYLRKVLFI